jgi:hypothetical protein
MLNAQTAKSEDDFSGKSRPSAGRYHAAVNHAEEKGSKKKGTPGLELEFVIIHEGVLPDGKTPTVAQAQKTIPLFLSYIGGDDAKTQTCLDRVTRLALSLGVLAPGEQKEVNWDEAVGRELVIEVEQADYPDEKTGQMKQGSQVSFMGFWSLGNKAVSNVPKDATSPGMQALAKSGGNGNGNGANAGAAAGAQSAPPPPPAAATAGKTKWSDL